MTRVGSRRAAFVIATAFVFAAFAPAGAEPSSGEFSSATRNAKAGKPISLTRPVAATKFSKSRTRVKLAARSRKAVKFAVRSQHRTRIAAKTKIDNFAVESNAIPATVANARAQLVETQPTAPAADPNAALAVAAVDQMNELDRALTEPSVKVASQEPALTEMAAATPAPSLAPPPAPPAPVYAQASNNRPWDESSLVGKIFIAFGGLLTLASAARMLIA